MLNDSPLPTLSLDEQWHQVCTDLLPMVGKSMYQSWIKPLSPISLSDDEVKLAVPTKFIKDWVNTHYLDKIKLVWRKIDPSIRSITLSVISVAPTVDSLVAPSYKLDTTQNSVSPISVDINDDRDVQAALDPRFTFENFVVGKPNELAHAAARRVADAKQVTFNPLFLYGGVGLGKTHLMHAIAWQIRKNDPKRRVLYLSAEKFMYQFIKSIRFKDTVSFKELFRSVDVLMIDDVQFISGKESTQEEFFHTFNALVDQNRQVIISADKSPSDLEGMEERLKSRLGWGLVADIHPTTYELRLGILQSKAEQLNFKVSSKVLEFLAHKINSSVRELEGALNRIMAYSDLMGREVVIDEIQDILRDLLRANDKRISIDDIQRKVAEHYTIKLADMSSTKRSRSIVRPRQIAMYLCKNLTTHSYPEIGRRFGGRDHTTVIHAIEKVEELMSKDQSINEDVALLKRMLSS